MKFQELLQFMKDEFDIDVQADIARELEVTPQTLNNWKIRGNVPYKYVKKIKKKVSSRIKNNVGGMYLGQQNINDTYRLSNEEDESHAFEILKIFIKDIKKYYLFFIFILVLLSIYSIVSYKYFLFPKYSSNASIVPTEGSNNLSNSLASLGQSFGVTVPNQDFSLNRPPMIVQLLTSKSFALKILNKKFDSKTHGPDKKLINILSPEIDLSSINLSRNDSTTAAKSFTEKNIKILKTKNPNVVEFATYFYEPELTAKIAKTIINELDGFIKNHKKSKNSSKKEFILDRSEQVFLQLSIEEDKLKNFRQKNRNILSSPELLLEQTRLIRNVEVQSQLYITLLSQYELVSIEESENFSFIEVLDGPFVPTSKIYPVLSEVVAYNLIFGFLFCVLIAYVHNGKAKILYNSLRDNF